MRRGRKRKRMIVTDPEHGTREWSEDPVGDLMKILQVDVPEKYYLSAKACRGILTRASRRGKKLQELLETALLEMIEWWASRGGKPTP